MVANLPGSTGINEYANIVYMGIIDGFIDILLPLFYIFSCKATWLLIIHAKTRSPSGPKFVFNKNKILFMVNMRNWSVLVFWFFMSYLLIYFQKLLKIWRSGWGRKQVFGMSASDLLCLLAFFYAIFCPIFLSGQPLYMTLCVCVWLSWKCKFLHPPQVHFFTQPCALLWPHPVERPGHMDTGTLGHRDTGTPGHWATGTLGLRDTRTPGQWVVIF